MSRENWCYTCHTDHPIEPGKYYVICFECGHVYYTARELRKAYRAQLRQPPITGKRNWIRPGLVEPSWLEVLWHSAKIRAKKIHFCQECSHDF